MVVDGHGEGDCPSEDALVEFVEGGLDEASVEAIDRHLDQCARCAETVALFGGAFADQTVGSPGAQPAPDPEEEPAHEPVRYADRYRIDECVGGGAGGVVYRARDLELDRDVALKVLRAEDEATEGSSSARWRREAQIMARVDHPNVVTVHDVGVAEGRVFLAMDYVEGQTLRQWLESRRRRGWPRPTRPG